jgi:hypothetical protein
MAVEVHVTGRIAAGTFAEFAQAVTRWAAYREAKGDASARVLQGLSGPMNHVPLVGAGIPVVAFFSAALRIARRSAAKPS